MVLGILKHKGLIMPFQSIESNEAYDYELEKILCNSISFYDENGRGIVTLDFESEKICNKAYKKIWYDISHGKTYFDLDGLNLKTGEWKAW